MSGGPGPFDPLDDASRRRRREKVKRLLLFVGVPVLAFILISEGVNLLQRNNTIQRQIAGEVIEQTIRQAPEILDAINDGDDPETAPPPEPSTPAPADPTPDAAASFAGSDSSIPPGDLPGLIATAGAVKERAPPGLMLVAVEAAVSEPGLKLRIGSNQFCSEGR